MSRNLLPELRKRARRHVLGASGRLSAGVKALLLVVILLSAISRPASAQENGGDARYRVTWGVRIPLRGGLTLNATVYRPAREERAPVIMTLTPYVADRFHEVAAYFAQHGYVFALVDSRGRGNSDGSFEPWVQDGQDGYDAVQWLARQPFTDGQVAMWGGSYGGKNQWAVASLAPPALRTIVPASAGYVGYDVPMRRNIPMPWSLQYLTLLAGRTSNRNLYSDQSFWNSAFFELSRGQTSFRDFGRITGIESSIFHQWANHPHADLFWDMASPDPRSIAAIEIPVLTITGFYDDAQGGALEFQRLHLAGASARARAVNYALVGPWDHVGTRAPTRALGGVDFGPGAELDILALHLGWYDWIMRGGPRPAFLRQSFVYYLAGANQWASSESMPVSLGQTLFLSSAGRPADSLATRGDLAERPSAQPPDHYRYDPSLPARNEGVEAGSAVSASYLADPRSFAVLNGDGLVYDSRPFERPSRLVGRPRAVLTLSMDVPDTDIRVQLFQVRPDSSVIFLGQDLIRARYRRDARRPELVPMGRPQEYVFDQFPFTAWGFEQGTRLRLVISPLGMSIHNQRNRNSGRVVADETAADNRVARVSVMLGRGRSRLTVPVQVDP